MPDMVPDKTCAFCKSVSQDLQRCVACNNLACENCMHDEICMKCTLEFFGSGEEFEEEDCGTD
jgi:hypothetical protein